MPRGLSLSNLYLPKGLEQVAQVSELRAWPPRLAGDCQGNPNQTRKKTGHCGRNLGGSSPTAARSRGLFAHRKRPRGGLVELGVGFSKQSERLSTLETGASGNQEPDIW